MNRKLSLTLVLVPLLILFIYVALRSGPLSPVAVVVTSVATGTLQPAIAGIGITEAKYWHKISATQTARIQQILVEVGDRVEQGQPRVT